MRIYLFGTNFVHDWVRWEYLWRAIATLTKPQLTSKVWRAFCVANKQSEICKMNLKMFAMQKAAFYVALVCLVVKFRAIRSILTIEASYLVLSICFPNCCKL